MAFQTVITGYLALGTAFTTSGVFTEQTGAGYARIAVPLLYDPYTGMTEIVQGVTFGATGSWSASTYAALFDSATGGNNLLTWQIPSFTLASGATQSYAAHAFDMTLKTFTAGVPVATMTTLGSINNASGLVLGSSVVNPVSLTYNGATLAASGASYTPAAQPPVQFRNLLDGGDFTVNPFQRNAPGLASGGVISSAISNTVTYFADRWFAVGGASSAILMASVANVSVAGFSTALQFQRQSGNTNTAAINLGQVIETADSIRMQGQTITFSFWAAAGSGYTGGALTVQVISGTGSNQSAANMVAGSWTGQTSVVNTTQAINTTMTRYSFGGVVPAGCTQLGVLVSYTPSGTAGANDFVQFMGCQIEQGAAVSPFEHRDAQVELEICQRYAWLTPEPAAGVIVGAGMNTGASAQVFYMATPVQFYKAPTVTVAAGTFKTNQAGTATACTITAGATHTPNAISVNGNSAGTAGQGTLLQGGGGSGYILASADF
jgi:hypothetical protein